MFLYDFHYIEIDTLVIGKDKLKGETNRIVRSTFRSFNIIISLKSRKYYLVTDWQR